MTEPVKCPCCGQVTKPAGVVRVSLEENRLWYGKHALTLRLQQAELAYVLARRMPETVLYETIIGHMWGANENVDAANAIKVLIHQLRPHLARIGLTIRNTRDRGYRMEAAPAALRTERSTHKPEARYALA